MSFSVIDFLRPKKIQGHNRLRLGSFHDGGYVLLDSMIAPRLYSFGVGDETSLEVDFIKREGRVAHLYDHTVDLNVPSILSDKMIFHKKALAMKRTPHGDTVVGHIEANGDLDHPVLVTIDVEGFELDYFMIDHNWDNVLGMIVEFHIYNRNDDVKLVECLKKISEDFVTYHVHGNNWELRTFELEGKDFPRVFEVGFLSRGFAIGGQPANEELPLKGLDYPCKPGQPDIPLTHIFYDGGVC